VPTPNTSVDQIFDALHYLAAAGGPVGPAELARTLGLSMSTAHRLLVTLHDSGYAERDTTGGRFELGHRSYQLVHALFRQFGVRSATQPFLRRLAELTGETALLDVRVGWYGVRAAGVEGWREVHQGTMIGLGQPLAATAPGRAMLERMDDADRAQYERWARNRDLAHPPGAEARLIWPSVREPGIDGPTLLEATTPENHGVLSHVVHGAGRPLAVVSLQGAGPLLARDVPAGELDGVLALLAELDRLLAARPELGRDPFGHLDPDDVLAPIPRPLSL
jgi:DNA-binding IclR family transcriptional regulator